MLIKIKDEELFKSAHAECLYEGATFVDEYIKCSAIYRNGQVYVPSNWNRAATPSSLSYEKKDLVYSTINFNPDTQKGFWAATSYFDIDFQNLKEMSGAPDTNKSYVNLLEGK